MDSQRSVAVLQRIVEAEVGRRVVHWIAAENHQHLYFASLQVGNEFFERVVVVSCESRNRIGINDGFAHIAELLVDCVAKSVDNRRLMIAGDDDAGAAVRQEFLCHREYKCVGIACCVPSLQVLT